MSIIGIVSDLKLQIKELNRRVEQIQTKCSHPEEAVIKVHKSNTGNYDPSCDSYWIEFDCGLCLKHWIEEC